MKFEKGSTGLYVYNKKNQTGRKIYEGLMGRQGISLLGTATYVREKDGLIDQFQRVNPKWVVFGNVMIPLYPDDTEPTAEATCIGARTIRRLNPNVPITGIGEEEFENWCNVTGENPRKIFDEYVTSNQAVRILDLMR